MKVLVLAAGAQPSQPELPPVWLEDPDLEMFIEKQVRACDSIFERSFVFAVREKDISKFHVDSIISLVAPGSVLLRVKGQTAGAACTALLATPFLDMDQSLLIINANEFLDASYCNIISDFERRGLDAGIVTFPSAHPRYSYVKVDQDGLVIEAAEKNPISRNATAGFYWFRRASDFVKAVKSMIRKGAHVDGEFFICPAFNQMILSQARIGIYQIEPSRYHPLKSQWQVEHFAPSKGNLHNEIS